MNWRTVEVNADVFEFLKRVSYSYPSCEDLSKMTEEQKIAKFVKAASFAAYRDFCRTLRFKEKTENKREKLKKKATDNLHEAIGTLVAKKIESQQAFDDWHHNVCEVLKKIYSSDEAKTILKQDFVFAYGQAQKWLNMTLKNLFVLDVFTERDKVVEFFHVPVDNFVIDNRPNGVTVPVTPWSQWDFGDYDRFQKALRKSIKDKSLYRWEFQVWNSAK